MLSSLTSHELSCAALRFGLLLCSAVRSWVWVGFLCFDSADKLLWCLAVCRAHGVGTTSTHPPCACSAAAERTPVVANAMHYVTKGRKYGVVSGILHATPKKKKRKPDVCDRLTSIVDCGLDGSRRNAHPQTEPATASARLACVTRFATYTAKRRCGGRERWVGQGSPLIKAPPPRETFPFRAPPRRRSLS